MECLDNNGDWTYEIDGDYDCFLDAETLEEAKDESLEKLEKHCEDQISYYKEIINSIKELEEE